MIFQLPSLALRLTSANKKPLKMKVKPYYKSFMLNTYSKLAPLKINNKTKNDDIYYIDLKNIEW